MYDATVDIVFTAQKEGIFSSASISSKLLLENFILKNASGFTGFLIWFSNYGASCIFQHNSKTKSTKYYIRTFHSDGTLDQCQTVNDSKFLLKAFANTVTKISRTNDSEVAYSVRFLCCYNNLSSSLKQKVLQQHKSNPQKKALAGKKEKVMQELNLLPNENT